MSVIERWWLVMDRDDAPHSVRSTRASADAMAEQIEGGWIEVVPADQHRGAVSALQALIDAGTEVQTFDATADDWRAWQAAVARAQAIIGGQ